MSAWLWIKGVHLTCVTVTLGLFLLRGGWALQGTLAARGRWVRVLPHVNDTLLLTSAITLAVLSGQYPLQQGWLTAKVAGMLLYIVLGEVALRHGLTRRVRIAVLLAALTVFAYIVATAVTRNYLPWQ